MRTEHRSTPEPRCLGTPRLTITANSRWLTAPKIFNEVFLFFVFPISRKNLFHWFRFTPTLSPSSHQSPLFASIVSCRIVSCRVSPAVACFCCIIPYPSVVSVPHLAVVNIAVFDIDLALQQRVSDYTRDLDLETSIAKLLENETTREDVFGDGVKVAGRTLMGRLKLMRDG